MEEFKNTQNLNFIAVFRVNGFVAASWWKVWFSLTVLAASVFSGGVILKCESVTQLQLHEDFLKW
jgi:hypothetical protein